MSDNFHGASCALRHGGTVCDCGFIKPLSAKEKEIVALRAAITDAREAITAAAQFVGDPKTYDLLITWLARYPKDTP